MDLVVTGQALALLIAGVAPWPLIRALSSSQFRLRFNRLAWYMGAALSGYWAALIAVAMLNPTLLPFAAALGLLGIAAVAIRSRSSYGVARGLPPGSLSLLPLKPWFDPNFFADQVAKYGPVFKISQFHRPMVCVVGLGSANELLSRYDEVLVAPPLPFNRFIEKGYLRYLKESEHARYRTLFHAIFSRSVVEGRMDTLVDTLRRGLLELVSSSAAQPGAGVAPAAVIKRSLFTAWVGLFLGIDDAEVVRRLRGLFTTIDIRNQTAASSEEVRVALNEIEKVVEEKLQSFRAQAADAGKPTSFLAELAALPTDDAGCDPARDKTVIGNLIYVMHVSWSDVGGLLVWLLKMLSDHPRWAGRLRENPDLGAAERVVLETLRLEQSEHRYRLATADVEVGGYRVPRGTLIRICVRESHQDPNVFESPALFNPDRFINRTYTRAEYAPFGNFRLACLGEHLTRMVGARFVDVLARGFEWTKVADGPRELASTMHWTPSKDFRIEIQALGAD